MGNDFLSRLAILELTELYVGLPVNGILILICIHLISPELRLYPKVLLA